MRTPLRNIHATDRASPTPPELTDSAAKHRGSEASRLQEALSERLSQLERRLEDETLGEGAPAGAVEQFVNDVAKEARGAGTRLWNTLAAPRALALRVAEAVAWPQIDERGVDVRLRDAMADAVRPMSKSWFGLKMRTEIPLPQRGGVLLAFNRSAWPLPTEGLILAALVGERARRRDVYILWDVNMLNTPGLGPVLRRLGVLPAEPGSAGRLLEDGNVVVAFPEGAAAREKSYAGRYRVEDFAAGFIIEEAVAAGAAIVPGAVVGHEESHPVLGRFAGLPLTPTFPFTGLFGLVPLPLGWRVRIGVPVMHENDATTKRDALDALRAQMNVMLAEMLAERRSIVRG